MNHPWGLIPVEYWIFLSQKPFIVCSSSSRGRALWDFPQQVLSLCRFCSGNCIAETYQGQLPDMEDTVLEKMYCSSGLHYRETMFVIVFHRNSSAALQIQIRFPWCFHVWEFLESRCIKATFGLTHVGLSRYFSQFLKLGYPHTFLDFPYSYELLNFFIIFVSNFENELRKWNIFNSSSTENFRIFLNLIFTIILMFKQTLWGLFHCLYIRQ